MSTPDTTNTQAAPAQQPAAQAPGAPAAEPDFGSKQERPRGFSVPFLKLMRQTPYLPPADVVVAGDASSEQGRALAGTFLDDGRANLPWSDDHEKIVMGFLTGSTRVKVKVAKLDAAGQPVVGEDGAGATETIEVMITDGQPELVYLQGSDDDWYPVCVDGRQRRKAALELQRRLDWCASLINAIGEAGKSKPGRRNLLIKVGNLYSAKGKTWPEIVAELNLPADRVVQYQSPEIGTATVVDAVLQPDGGTRGVTTYPAPLNWLTETFAKMVVGCEDLGDSNKKGWLENTKDDGGNATGVKSHLCWLKISVVATNVDPADPKSLLEGVANKEAQVPTPPSLLAGQIKRILDAPTNPSDPESPPLYTRQAVRERFGMSDPTLQRYELLCAMCDEVKKLIDDGQMSMNVALGMRESAFVTWPKKGDRAPLPYDKQRLVLAHLLAEFTDEGTDEDGPRFVGPKVLELGTKLRNKAMAGKLGPVGSEDEEDDTAGAVLAPGTKRATSATGAGTNDTSAAGAHGTDAAPTKKGRGRTIVDIAAFREHAGRAIGALPVPAEDTAAPLTTEACRTYRMYRGAFDELTLAQSLVLVLCGAEPLATLDAWPLVRDLVAASTPAAPASAAPALSEDALILDWISVATEEMSLQGKDTPVVTTATTSGGRQPTAEQAAAANARIAGFIAAFKADTTATSLDEFILTAVVQAQGASAAA